MDEEHMLSKYLFKTHLGCTFNSFLSTWPKGSKLTNFVCKMWHRTDFLSFKVTGSHSQHPSAIKQNVDNKDVPKEKCVQ